MSTHRVMIFKRLLRLSVIGVTIGVLFVPQLAGALADDQRALMDSGVNYFDIAVATDACATDSSTSDTTTLSGTGHVAQAYNFFAGKPGMTPQAAAGLVGNMQVESGKDLDPTALNSIGAYGIVQWYKGRRTNLEEYASKHGTKASDFTTQLNFAWQELTTGYKDSTLTPIENAPTASKAAFIVYKVYENPGDGSYPTREANATKIYNTYKGQVAAASTDTTSTSTTDDPSGGAADDSTSDDTSCTSSSDDTSATTSTASGSCNVTQPATEDEYSQAQLTKIFGKPGTSSSHPDLHLTQISFNGRKLTVSPLVAPCLLAVAKQIKDTNISYKIRMMGCYRFDSDNGTTNIGLKSYHTYGAACDINWDTNPIVVGSSAHAGHDMPQSMVEAFRDHGFTWGGSWHSKKDYMHFEFHGIKP